MGGGAWGTAFSGLLLRRGHEVTLAVRPTLDDAPYEDADLVVLAVPSDAFRDALGHVRGTAPVLSLVKGLDPQTGNRLSTLVTDRPVAVLSGPNMAEEVAAGLPGAAVITRGLVEMARLGEACGAEPETFSGLAGMGDLVVTCWHPSGRNRRAGELIARGMTADEARAEIGQVVEGLTTAPVLRDLSHRLGIELPITEGVCAVLEGLPLNDLLASLMGRRPTDE